MDFRAIFMGFAFAFMWSSAFTSARIIVVDAPPLTALALRFLLSGLISIILARALGQSWHLTRKQWIAVVIFGICQNALYLGLNFIAMQSVEASLAAIIASTMPLLVALAGWLIFRERVGALGILGLLAGIGGVGLIMGTRISMGVDGTGLLLCGIGVLALTFATLAVRTVASGNNVLMVVGLQMLVGFVAVGAVGIPTEELTVNWSWKLIAAFAYTTFIPGILATVVWFHLVGRIGAVRASTFHFLNPFLGVAVAAVLLGENLGLMDIIGVAVIAGGILAVQLSKQKS